MSGEGPQAAEWRRAIYGEGAPDRTDLVAVMTLAVPTDDPDLLALVADVARDALLVDGVIGCDDSDWLMEACGDGHGLGSRAEFVALASVLRHAAPTAAELVAFAAREIERAILTGERAYLGAANGEPGRINAGDVAILREITGSARADRALAEALFDIAHATSTAANDPAFDEFFAERLWAYLSGEMAGGERFAAFLSQLDAGPAPPPEAAEPLDGLDEPHYREAARAVFTRYETAAHLSSGGARWALAHLSRGALSSAERRLVAKLRDPQTLVRRHAA